MFLFKKSVIGAYCNRLYDLKESYSPFLCYGRSKANSAGKNLNVTNRVSNFPALKKIRVMSDQIPGKNRDCIKYKQQNVNASSLL